MVLFAIPMLLYEEVYIVYAASRCLQKTHTSKSVWMAFAQKCMGFSVTFVSVTMGILGLANDSRYTHILGGVFAAVRLVRCHQPTYSWASGHLGLYLWRATNGWMLSRGLVGRCDIKIRKNRGTISPSQ